MELDLRGLKCPLPVLRTRKALENLPQDEELVVLCSDPLAIIDIPDLLQQTGDVLVSQEQIQEQVGEIWRFVIRKNE